MHNGRHSTDRHTDIQTHRQTGCNPYCRLLLDMTRHELSWRHIRWEYKISNITCLIKKMKIVPIFWNIMKYWCQRLADGVECLTTLDGELGLNGFKSNFFSADLLAGGSGFSFLYGFSSKKSLGAMLRRNAPPFVDFRWASFSRYTRRTNWHIYKIVMYLDTYSAVAL